ncbi:MAG TPA: phasin family protein [Burkholderiaceae bacterium]|jgi:phasin family protein
MFNFSLSQKDSPAANAYFQSQFSMYSDLTKQFFNAAQRVNELNIQVTQTLIDEALSNTQQVLSAKDPTEVLSVIAGQAQPNAEKVRAYQQHLTDIAANTQVDIIKSAENHIPEASRTVQDMAKEVQRKAAEETEQMTQRQKSAMEKLTSPITARQGPDTGAKGAQQKGAPH